MSLQETADKLLKVEALVVSLIVERNEATADRDRLAAEAAEHDVAFNAVKIKCDKALESLGKLEADNAALKDALADEKTEFVLAMIVQEQRAEVATLRARLTTANAVAEAANANIVGRLERYLHDEAKVIARAGFHPRDNEGWMQTHARTENLKRALEVWSAQK